VIHLPRGSRVQDALQAAGGFLADADDQALNLAAWVQDGELIRVPYQPQAVSGPPTTTRSGELPVPAPAASTGLVNINTATLEELDTLPGIGPAIAQRIIDYRSANGPFAAIEDIQDVSGIGPATFARLRDLISVTMD
jgi:competence protein ComEA